MASQKRRAFYILSLFAISIYISRKKEEELFLIAGRNRKTLQILLSKFATSAGAAYFITYTGFAYKYGAGVFAILLGSILGYLIFAFWAAPKIAKNSKEGKFYTMGHFVKDRLGSEKLRIVVDIVSSVILFLWLVVGIIGGGKIISDFGLLSYNSSVMVTSLVVLGYLLLAGYHAVLITDVIQSAIILFLLCIITGEIVSTSTFADLSSLLRGKVDMATVSGFFIYGIFSIFSFSDRYQLCYAAKSEKDLKLGMSLPLIPILMMAYFLFLIGIYTAKQTPNLDEALVFIWALKHFLSPSLLPLAIVLFFAGIMSSADTSIYAIASHYAFLREDPHISFIAKIKKSTVYLVVLLTLAAIAFPDIIKVSVFAAIVSLLLTFPMIYLISGGRDPSRFLASFVTSFVGMIIGLMVLGVKPSALIGVVIVGPVGLLYSSKQDEASPAEISNTED
ncbi:MAG: hypothetical protein D6808_03265 [Candidatus Dadabacteria bacterium]|nr:MAG: hypothetical protein D6808_03265 [Candidatus Dadabacteria bacterium]